MSNSKPRRVFIAECVSSHIDLSKAEKYGEVVIVMKDRGAPASETGAFLTRLQDRLDELKFDPTTDYFCVVGAILPVSISIAALLHRYDVISLLVYSTTTERYVERTIDFRRFRHG